MSERIDASGPLHLAVAESVSPVSLNEPAEDIAAIDLTRRPVPFAKGIDLLLGSELFWVAPALLTLYFSRDYWWLGAPVALLPWLLRRLRYGAWSVVTPFDWPIKLLLIGALIGFVVSPQKALALEALHGYLAVILIYYLIVNNNRPFYVGLTAVLTAVGLLWGSVWVFAQGQADSVKITAMNAWAFRLFEPLPRFTDFTPDPNSIAVGVAAATPALIGLALFDGPPRRLRLVAGCLAAVFALIVALSASRSGWLALTVAILFLMGWRSRRLLLLVPLAAAAIFWVIAQDPQELAQITSNDDLIKRIEVWQTSLRMLSDQPFTGLGLGYFPFRYHQYMDGSDPFWVTNPHNAYLQLYADLGLLGVVAGLLVAVRVGGLAATIFRTPRDYPWYGFAVGVVAGVLAAAVQGIFEASTAVVFADSQGNFGYVASPLPFVLGGMLVLAAWYCSRSGGPALSSKVGSVPSQDHGPLG